MQREDESPATPGGVLRDGPVRSSQRELTADQVSDLVRCGDVLLQRARALRAESLRLYLPRGRFLELELGEVCGLALAAQSYGCERTLVTLVRDGRGWLLESPAPLELVDEAVEAVRRLVEGD